MATVLVIDDEDTFRELLCEMLKASGHRTLDAENGVRGLQIVAQQRPDLVITDILMPEQEGIETIQRLREMHDDLPIIAISGMWGVGPFEPLNDAMLMGASVALPKPFERKDLMAEVERLLGTAV